MPRPRAPLPRRTLLALALALPAPALSGCAGSGPKACTEIGCGPSLSIQLTKLSAWAPGRYAFTIKHDDAQTECAVELPLRCDAPAPCGGAEVQLGLSGCALDPAEHAITEIEFINAPAQVNISVSYSAGDQAAGVGADADADAGADANAPEGLGDAEFAPTYRSSRPNGPECDPECKSAAAQLVMKLR
ncbi:MAG: hypothetical protein KC468_14805 [Myxococcales bacterium]|nr:hypothetical protein [Myxococcales bacterium]